MSFKSARNISRSQLVICICGMAGSGKSTVSKKLAKRYGLRYHSGGDALKAVAKDLGYNTTKEGWWETDEGIKFIEERLNNLSIDRKVDEKLLEWAKKGGAVFDCWALPWLLERGLKIWLEASEEVRSKRIAERNGLKTETALIFLREKEAKTKAIYEKLYGFKLNNDFSPFKVILDVNTLSKNEVFTSICMVIENISINETEKCC